MDGISSKLDGGLLFSQMQSSAALDKVGKGKATESDGASGGVGNVLHSFGNILKEQMNHINNLQEDANQATQTYATGGEIDLHNVMIATEKADLSLQLAMQIRNKMVAAYQEVSHMTI